MNNPDQQSGASPEDVAPPPVAPPVTPPAGEAPPKTPENTEQRPDAAQAAAIPDAPKDLRQILISQKERSIESQGLALHVTEKGIPTEAGLVEYFGQHRNCLARLESTPEAERAGKLAKEILLLESAEKKLIGQFVQQLEKAKSDNLIPDIQDADITQGISRVREALYGIIMSGTLSAEKLSELVSEIRFEPSPAAAEKKDLVASCGPVGNDKKIVITVYSDFLNKTGGQAHVIRHEVAHAINEATEIWTQEIYGTFLDCAKDPNDSRFTKLKSDAPALADIVEMVANPGPHKDLWSKYINTMLQNLEKMDEKPEKANLRARAAREIATDMTAFYMESGGQEELMVLARMQFARGKTADFLGRASGGKTGVEFQAFCTEHGAGELNLETTSATELVRKLADVPEFQPLYGSCIRWGDKMKEVLKDGGADLTRRTYQPGLPSDEKYQIEETEEEKAEKKKKKDTKPGEDPVGAEGETSTNVDDDDTLVELWTALTKGGK